MAFFEPEFTFFKIGYTLYKTRLAGHAILIEKNKIFEKKQAMKKNEKP